MRHFAALSLVSTLMAAPVAAAYDGPVIDVHMHVYPADPRWAAKVPNPATGAPLVASTEEAHRGASLEAMAKHGITTAIVSNDYATAQRWRAAAPDKVLVSYAFDDPSKVDLGFVRKEHAAGRIMALGEVGLQYAGISPGDPRMEPIYGLAEELDIPVAIHMGLSAPRTPYTCCPDFRVSLGDPVLLEPVLVKHPRLRVSIMHAGYPYLESTKAILHMYPQVYVDIGVIDWAIPRDAFHPYLKALVDAGFGKRIMFGSDQMVWPDAIGPAVESIREAPFLTEAQKRDILHDNAATFFRIGAGAHGGPGRSSPGTAR